MSNSTAPIGSPLFESELKSKLDYLETLLNQISEDLQMLQQSFDSNFATISTNLETINGRLDTLELA